MTYEEAISYLKQLRPIPIDGFKITAEAYDMAIKALEKQIPKKPVYKDELFLGKHWKAPHCPTCGDSWNGDEYGEGMKYCWECGQAILWEEWGK